MNEIKDAIYNAIKRERDAEPPRQYLGASSIGRDCDREIWYGFRHGGTKSQFNGRTYRLFEHGDTEEERIVRDLRRAGFKVIDKKPDGEQIGFETHGGMFRGHIDGVILLDGEPTLLECKTANEKSFDKMAKDGIKKSKPEYYAQAQIYMHYVEGKSALRKALFFVVNKNNDDIYTELIDYNETNAKRYSDRALSIIQTTHEATASPGWKCGFCAFANMCKAHNKPKDETLPAVPVAIKSCRQCVHSEFVNSEWRCKKHGVTLDFDAQLKACGDHVFLPDFVGFADAVDFADDGINYRKPNGEEFNQGPNGIDSEAMMFYAPAYINKDNAEELIKRAFGGKVTEREEAPF
jgi:CRISPR/Cas system-associated exonuclease Cas4 (RecB family)